MTKKETLKLFEERKVRTVWDDEKEKWYFSIVDVVSVLTDSVDATAYWRKLKQRLKEEGNERRCVKMRTFFFYAQSPDFHKQGLCYYLKILYL